MLNYNQFLKMNEEKKTYSYGCAMLFFDFPEIENIHSKIDKKDIYVDESDPTFGLEKEPHCTLLYGLHEDVKDQSIIEILDKYKFTKCAITNISLFENDKFDVLKFDVENELLHTVNAELTKLPHTTSYPDYHPHLTVAYLQSGSGKKYVEKFNKLEYVLNPSHGVYSKPSGDKIKIKIKHETY